MAKKEKKVKEPKGKKASRAERKAEKQAQKAKKKPGGGILVGLLTFLLVLVGVCELGLLSFIGITMFRAKHLPPSTMDPTAGTTPAVVQDFRIQYSGPGRRVVDGVLVEGRELEQNMIQSPDTPSAA